LGGSHIGQVSDEKEAIRIMRSAIDRGITFMDNSWDYNDGASEIWMGKALKDGYRQKGLSHDQSGRPHAEGGRQTNR